MIQKYKNFIVGIVGSVSLLLMLGSNRLNSSQEFFYLFLILAVIALAYLLFVGIRVCRVLDKKEHLKFWSSTRLHFFMHIIPVAYFSNGYFWGGEREQDILFVFPMILFFFTGRNCWRINFKYFSRKLYRIFQIGNTQMLFYFPAAFLVDYLGWSSSEQPWFPGIARVYFLCHFAFAGFTVPFMERDLAKLDMKVEY